jgi:hypothetical protein
MVMIGGFSGNSGGGRGGNGVVSEGLILMTNGGPVFGQAVSENREKF